MTDSAHALSFGQAAERYDRYRPGYAPAAVVWALGARPLRVVDLGAGTGILSRLLRRLGHDVIAVEPDEQMRTRLAEVSPGVHVVGGRAEEIPLADASVDAVVAGQAYHWFERDRTHAELARVLRPDGVFAAFWNDSDVRTQWTVTYVEIIDGPLAAQPRPLSDFGPGFTLAAEGEFPHDISTSADDLVALATTRSPYLVGDAAARAALVGAIRALVEAAGLPERGPIAMPHVTRVHRSYRR